MSKQITITISEDELHLLIKGNNKLRADVSTLMAEAEQDGNEARVAAGNKLWAKLFDLRDRLESL